MSWHKFFYAKDLLDEINIEALRCKLEAKSLSQSTYFLGKINNEALKCKLEAKSLSQSTSDQELSFFSSPFNHFQRQAVFQLLE